MSILNDGVSKGWQSSDLHYVNSLFYVTQTVHRYALNCSWALTALSLFAKSITTNIQRGIERVSSLVSNCLQYLSFQPANKGLRKQNTTVSNTVVAKKDTVYPSIERK